MEDAENELHIGHGCPADLSELVEVATEARLAALVDRDKGITDTMVGKFVEDNRIQLHAELVKTLESSDAAEWLWAARIDDLIIGYARLYSANERQYVEVCVKPRFDGKGIDDALVDRALQVPTSSTDIYTLVLENHPEDLPLYERRGFEPTGFKEQHSMPSEYPHDDRLISSLEMMRKGKQSPLFALSVVENE